MQYNPSCTSPLCFLTLENGKEEQRSLADIQAYIEAENKRLERDPSRCFDSREINIRMEYRYCPNMIVIDTPGMLHPPKGKQLTPQQRAIAQAAREAEALVLSKVASCAAAASLLLCCSSPMYTKRSHLLSANSRHRSGARTTSSCA